MEAPRHVVLAVQGEKDADPALRVLTMKPFKALGRITVLTVLPYAHAGWPVGSVIPEPLHKELLGRANQFVDGVAAKLSTAGYDADREVVQGAPANEILKAASRHRANLIMMWGRHRGLSRVMMGSASHAVLHRASCPVLVMR